MSMVHFRIHFIVTPLSLLLSSWSLLYLIQLEPSVNQEIFFLYIPQEQEPSHPLLFFHETNPPFIPLVLAFHIRRALSLPPDNTRYNSTSDSHSSAPWAYTLVTVKAAVIPFRLFTLT